MRAWALALLAAACIGAAHGQLVIQDAKRSIDISGHVVHTTTQLTVRNDGGSAATSLLLCDTQPRHLAYLEVQVGGSEGKLQWAEAAAPAGAPAGAACRQFELAQPLQKGATVKLAARAAHTHVLRPEPSEMKQRDPQYVQWEGTAQLASPYTVEEQSTEVRAGGGGVQSWSQVEPSKRSGGRIEYGPYKAAAPWTAQPVSVHFENNSPFLVAAQLEREVEVSHWGNVYFEERYTIRNEGAKVVGEWSRFDLTTNPKQFARAAAPGFGALLPPAARALYFRDTIGNISSSATRYGSSHVDVQLQPRYPLFGGWTTSFLFGWSLPLPAAVSREVATGRSQLRTQVGPSIGELVVDELVVKVVLPEGATAPQVSVSLPMAAEPQHETKITYLDLLGRPVVVLRFRNFVPEMATELTVTYNYSPLGLLQKPALLLAAFGAIFAAAIVLSRSSLPLPSSADVAALAKAKAA